MIRLILIFLVFLFLLLPTCYNVGQFVLDKLKINFNKYLTIFVGFISIISLFQIVYYPAMTLQLPSLYLTVTGSLITLFLLVMDIYNIEKIKHFYNDKFLILLLFVTCVIFFVYMRTAPYDYWYFDDSFYFPLMYENADTVKLFNVQPRSGEIISKINNMYASQGYYLIGSYIISIYNIFKNILSLKFNYMANVHYFMTFPTFLMLVFVISGLAKQISSKLWKKVLFVSLYIFSIIFLALDSNLLNNILMTGYIGVFVILTVLIPFLIYIIFEYIKGERKYAFLIAIFFMTMLSCASFSIFIIFILLYTTLLILYFMKKEKHLNDFAIMLLPAFLFLSDFVFSSNIVSFVLQIIIITLYALYFKFNKSILKLEDKIFNILKYFVIAFSVLPIILSALLIISKRKINCTTTEYLSTFVNALFPLFGSNDFHYSYIIVTIFNILYVALLLYLLLYRKQTMSTYILYFCCIAGIFLNPFAIPFISTALTSETYNRIFVLIFNPILYYSVFEFFLDNINGKKVIMALCVLFSACCILVQLKEFQYWVSIVGRSDKMYRLRESDIVASEKLEKYASTNNIKDIKIATVHSELKIFNPEIYSLLDRTLKYIPDDTFTKRAYYISVLYYLNRGEIKQEYIDQFGEDFDDVFKHLNINFITIDLECSVDEYQNTTPNVLCPQPIKKEGMLDSEYEKMLEDYKEDKEIYNNLLKKLKFVYQTERYRLYYVKESE